jgi:hypothetical protein
MASIRRWAHEQGFSIRRTDKQLLAEIAQALFIGRIAIADRRFVQRRTGGGGGANSAQSKRDKTADQPSKSIPLPRSEKPDQGPVPPSKPESQTKSWIEFNLLDETTGKPISGVAFKIQLTDGSIVKHTTNGAGKIRIDGIDPGTCGIREIAADKGPEVTKVI